MSATKEQSLCPRFFVSMEWIKIGLVVIFSLWFQRDVLAQFSFITNKDSRSITIVNYSGSEGTVQVPRLIGGLPVTSIGSTAFVRCFGLTNVSMPDSITTIQDGAFANCFALKGIAFPRKLADISDSAFYHCGITNLMIPGGVTNIGDFSFSYCTNLSDVNIPPSVNNIGDRAFFACRSLNTVSVDNLNRCYTSSDGVLFNKNQQTIILCPSQKVGIYSIPYGVVNIDFYAFSGCVRLFGVLISDSVVHIGDFAFAECERLTNVTLGRCVANIGRGSFMACSNLTSLTLTACVTNINDKAFSWCPKLIDVCFMGNAPVVGEDVFAGSTNVVVYYLKGAKGWGKTFSGRPLKCRPEPE